MQCNWPTAPPPLPPKPLDLAKYRKEEMTDIDRSAVQNVMDTGGLLALPAAQVLPLEDGGGACEAADVTLPDEVAETTIADQPTPETEMLVEPSPQPTTWYGANVWSKDTLGKFP